jgi:predicted RNA-binding Zn-ribbon protein involved in translation (DUF1610 family)
VSLLERSKQRWKIYLFITLMGIGAGITLLQGFLYDPLGKELTTQLAVGAMVIIVVTFIWAGQNIVCPHCGLRLLYYSITRVGLGTWYVWLLSEEKCPKCGFDGYSVPKAAKPDKSRKPR